MTRRDLLYLDLALEGVARGAAERGAGAAGGGAGALVGPLLQNLVLSVGDNEELCYCLKAWQALPAGVTAGAFPGREDALKARARQTSHPRGRCQASYPWRRGTWVGDRPYCATAVCLHTPLSAHQSHTQHGCFGCVWCLIGTYTCACWPWLSCVPVHARLS